MNKRRFSLLLICLVAPFAAADDDFAALIESCDDCHGKDGVSEWNDMPTIGGIDPFVHSEAFYAYQDRARPCAKSKYRRGDTDRPETDMCEIADELDDDQIEAIAEHYAKLEFVPAKQDFDPALAAKGKEIHDAECDRCHSDGGSNPEDEAGILSGQWMGYLETTFAQYASGERDQPKKMKDKMDPLTAEDTIALIHYYASQQ